MNSHPTPLQLFLKSSLSSTATSESLQKPITASAWRQRWGRSIYSRQWGRVKTGVIRGMHFQKVPLSQAYSRAFRKHHRYSRWSTPRFPHLFKAPSHELSADNHKQLFIPKSFAHGYCVCSSSATVLYKVDAPYALKPRENNTLRSLFRLWLGAEKRKKSSVNGI